MLAIQHFFDPLTYTLSYVVYDTKTKDGVIIDPVLDFDYGSATVTNQSLKKLEVFIESTQIKPHLVLETHAHADHLSGSQVLRQLYPKVKIGISARIVEVQEIFKEIYNFGDDFHTDGRQFDYLLNDHQKISAGSIVCEVMFTPGHTPACVSYKFDNHVMTGDALFMPDYGTGRCDFPGGSAADLYQSITKRLYTLPRETLVYTGHDYQPNGRELAFCTTIGDQIKNNIQLNERTTRQDFISFRQNRDKTLAAPKLLHPSIQVNIDAGHLPHPETNGTAYLKLPITLA